MKWQRAGVRQDITCPLIYWHQPHNGNHMSREIISAIRQNLQLKNSLLLSAIELAHRADSFSGIVRISYSYLASKNHMSVRQTIRHINKLIDLGIISCQRFCQHGRKWLVNLYQFKIEWQRPKPAQMGSRDKMSENLPYPQNTREKYGTMEGEEKGRQRVLGWLTPGSEIWKLAGGEE